MISTTGLVLILSCSSMVSITVMVLRIKLCIEYTIPRVSVQGVKSLGGHFACRGFEFYEVKKKIAIIFQKENGNAFTLLIIFIVKSLQKEQNSTNQIL